VLFCIAGQGLSKEANPELPAWQQALLVSATISALFITAHWQRKRSRKNAWDYSLRPRDSTKARFLPV
jgi:hypothetical protein